jgi:hypothetical protein
MAVAIRPSLVVTTTAPGLLGVMLTSLVLVAALALIGLRRE